MRLLGAAALALPAFGAQAAAVLTTLYSFGSITNASGDLLDGANPQAGLVQGSDGNFYGTTREGGTNDFGTVFQITPNGALTSLYSFTGGSDGEYPMAGLVQGSDGYFYGTTWGEMNPIGTVFKISTNGVLTTLYSFGGGNDGANPQAGLVQGSDGNFYGTTEDGGTNGSGTVFKISTNGVLTTLCSFGSLVEESSSGLVQGSDGNLYGTSGFVHGPNIVVSLGTVFKISTNGALTSLFSFTGGIDGAIPEAGLVQGSDGNFYGTTEWNGVAFNPYDESFYFVGAGTVLPNQYRWGADGAL